MKDELGRTFSFSTFRWETPAEEEARMAANAAAPLVQSNGGHDPSINLVVPGPNLPRHPKPTHVG